MEHEYNQQKLAFHELTNQDWAKRVITFKEQVSSLRTELVLKNNELDDIKKRVHQMLSTHQRDDAGAHYTAFFERQTQDLMYTKKIIAEYEKRESECTKKWNDLLNENQRHFEQIESLKALLHRQRDQYQQVITENERWLADANDKLTHAFRESDKWSAAEFLVNQIELLKEERRALLDENDTLNIKLHDLSTENDALWKDVEIIDFLHGVEGVHPQSDDEERMRRMFWRIEELEDLLIEMKQKSGVAKIVDQESQINALNLDVGVKEKVIRDLNNKFDELSKKET